MIPCPYFGYTERAARHKLNQHHRRGNKEVVMRWHESCGSWHVVELVALESLEPHD